MKNYKQLPQFGHGSDFTLLFSSDRKDQVDYAASLVALFVFLLMSLVLWTIMLATFKVMGPANAGFLSGHHFVVPGARSCRQQGEYPQEVCLVNARKCSLP